MGNQWGWTFTFASPNQNVGGTCPPVPLIIAAPGCSYMYVSHVCWNARRILVRGVNAPLPPEAKFFFENLTTKWCYLEYI